MPRMIETLVEDALFPESPRWHQGALWYSDIAAGQVCRVEAPGRKAVALSGLETPSGLGWTAQGAMLVASIKHSGVFRAVPGGSAEPFCPHERHGIRATNDMATRGARSYVTCADWEYFDGATYEEMAQPLGKILLVDHASGEGRVVAEGLKSPNGIGFSADGTALFVAETFGRSVWRYQVGADGSLSGRTLFADVGRPLDGLAVDAAGGVWVATGQDFQYLDPTGAPGAAVEVPGWKCIAPMLGGEDGRTLFMAVCQYESADDIMTGRGKGRIVMTRAEVPAA